ncbi:MAG: AraC family transcriptional regulator [Pleurocapsa minor GSE-CHR-MK-17-07R]|jgi:AraC-like DNA-binding protein|nr:AraC family transcriptional regulator [Pleurocapsa minor GSE-CHR-MK 17-07R]
MALQQTKMDEFVRLLEQHTPNEGVNVTILDNVGLSRMSQPVERTSILYEPAIFMMGQGEKVCYIGDEVYKYHAGKYLIVFLPMPLEVTVTDVSPEHPALMVGFRLKLSRLASVSLRLDAVDNTPRHQPQNDDPSGIYTSSMDVGLLDAAIRMLRTLSDPVEAAMLGEAILDEIYYRILREDRNGALRTVLQRQAQIQQIARAVDYIHQSMDQTISVEALAEMVNMSATTFHRHFKEVMHLPPLQYAKSIKLHRAQALIREGKRANEAGYMVGYNSPGQFSREYKRQFGYAPSAEC